MHSEESDLLIAVALAAIILLVVVSLLAWTTVRFAKRKSAIERESLVAGIQIQERERERIAIDLHDELGSLVSAIKIHMERSDMETANHLIDSTVNKVREIASDLSPRTLQLRGLVVAVKEFAAMLTTGKGMTIAFTADLEMIALPADKQLQVYRIIQEIIHNAVKYSEAAKITIALTLQNAMLEIAVSDDGKGFDMQEEYTGPGGHGLKNIATRVNILKGKLTVHAAPGKGVSYLIFIPVT